MTAPIPMKIGPDVAAGFNPETPTKDEAVICWGDKCAGNYSAPMGIGATARHVHAISCACARKQHSWVLE